MTESPDWHITGDWFDNCSCAVACPCTFAQAPDNGFCESFCSGISCTAATAISLSTILALSGWGGGRAICGRERPRAPPASSSTSAPTTARLRFFPGFSAARSEDSGSRRRDVYRRPANSGCRARAYHLRDRARPRALGNRDRGQGEGLGQSPDRTNEPAGEISAADQSTRFRDRARTGRDLGQIDGLLGRRVRLQVPVDDQFEQAHPVRLGRSLKAPTSGAAL